MACVDNMPPAHVESEMEEGEIVDDLDDLSDISSEEEFLLRQRLHVLESYNNVLERKKAKHSSFSPGSHYKKEANYLPDLSEISATELEEPRITKKSREHKIKNQSKVKRRKDIEQRNKEYRKKVHHHNHRKKLEVKIISETSEESEDEYRNKRRKLANAVVVNTDKSDKSSLSARLKKMLCKSENEIAGPVVSKDNQTKAEINNKLEEIFSPVSSITADDPILSSEIHDKILTPKVIDDPVIVSELIDLCTDDDAKAINIKNQSEDTTDSIVTKSNADITKDSDDDLELLRQHALKTKCNKSKSVPDNNHKETISEDEDSDTTELRLICLKSAILKKAIEMKQKQKLRKRLSQSSNLQDDFFIEAELFPPKADDDNNTDIESVDMDIGSDGEEKAKEPNEDIKAKTDEQNTVTDKKVTAKDIPILNDPKEDEFEEDEDLLRAKLLTSLSKNLPNLVNPSILNNFNEEQNIEKKIPQTIKVPEEKKFIINLESDSEGEHEATRNLTKMHIKLSEQIDFQTKLDMFLKSTRMEVEKTSLPDVVREPTIPKKSEKFVAKTVKHLPKSEQIEYKNLVKRMAELEKIKQSRQASMQLITKTAIQVKDTLKPRNVSIDTTKITTADEVEQQIAMSRKKIAEESAKMLKLKEEATKLSQKYKIVATELHNISTAITLNKKQQRSVQNCLAKIRLQHQKLLKSSTTSIHSRVNGIPSLNKLSNNIVTMTRIQKENDPSKEEYKNQQLLKTMKVSIVNDVNGVPADRLSVQVDVMSNKKTVKIPKKSVKDRTVDIQNDVSATEKLKGESISAFIEHEREASHPVVEKGGGTVETERDVVRNNQNDTSNKETEDYKSPLEALGATSWEADPNAILCPFEVGGECKDPDCNYLHTLSVQ